MRSLVRVAITCLFVHSFSLVHANNTAYAGMQQTPRPDTTAPGDKKMVSDATSADSLLPSRKDTAYRSDVNTDRLSTYPNPSLQEALKGNVAGLYVQQPNGEPASEMNMIIRGSAIPYINHKDIFETQPLILVDGIPLIMAHPFAYDIRKFDFNRIGTATNLLNAINLNNVASIRVLKDFAETAVYGPRAINGVIDIRTKAPETGKHVISFNTYFGFVQRPAVSTINAAFENNFRRPFYDKYATAANEEKYPSFLRDSTNPAYYGPSNWTDVYYKNSTIHAIDASLSGGSQRANFRMAIGKLRNSSVADGVNMDRYNANFAINMMPLRWLQVSTMINATRLERTHSNTLRDRFAEVQYLPDLTNPLPPNKDFYNGYLNEYSKSYDKNKANVINGFFQIKMDFNKVDFTTRLAFDYNEDLRDVFYPSTILVGNNYVSNYFGFSQRVIFDNTLRFRQDWNKEHFLTLEAGESFQSDVNKYNYGYAYRGPNDLIKLNVLNSDPNAGNYLTPKGFSSYMVYKFLDKERHRLLSFHGKAGYSYQHKLDFTVLVRADGSSNAQPDDWWTTSPTFSAAWNIKNTLLTDNNTFNALKLRASWGRLPRLNTYDRFAQGPQYTVDMGWSTEPAISSYDAVSGLSRPYNLGYIGYGITWPYATQLNVGVDVALLRNRIMASVDVYNKTDKNMLLAVPAYAEYGYSKQYLNGMNVRNAGVDLVITANVLNENSKLQWIPSVNVNYNKNKLLALPEGRNELIIGTKMLRVGSAIDQYWILQNEGIYNTDAEVPRNPANNMPLSYKGLALKAGDPKWKDTNGDFVIDDKDKVLTGHSLPVVSGNFNNDFTYKNFTLSVGLYYALGRKILNKDMANRFDFINRESTLDMNGVKEITFWSKTGDYSKYPIYNPWSDVVPYQLEQDLFLENGAFLKLRTLSLGYDFAGTDSWKNSKKKKAFTRLYLYVTANNLFTITPYTGRDPELVDFNGYDTGYGLPIPKTYTIGVKMDL
jgi:TonB-linked SusC/RagA family outer membrane protein